MRKRRLRRLTVVGGYASILSVVVTVVGFWADGSANTSADMSTWESILAIVVNTIPRWVPISLSLFFISMVFKWRREIERIVANEHEAQRVKEEELKGRRIALIAMWRRTVVITVEHCGRLNRLDRHRTDPGFRASRLKAIMEHHEGFQSLRRYLTEWENMVDSADWDSSTTHPRAHYVLNKIDELEQEWGLV